MQGRAVCSTHASRMANTSGPLRIRYPVRSLNDSFQYFARITAVNLAGLNITAAGLPIRVDTET